MAKQFLWRLNQVRHLSPREARLLLQAVIILPLTTLALRLFGYRRLHTFLAGTTPTSPDPSNDEVDVITEALGIARLVGAASVSLLPTTCLSRSLALWWLLRRQGITSDLCIGVAKDGGEFAAHAWVEVEGTVINDSPESIGRFTAFNAAIAPPGTESYDWGDWRLTLDQRAINLPISAKQNKRFHLDFR